MNFIPNRGLGAASPSQIKYTGTPPSDSIPTLVEKEENKKINEVWNKLKNSTILQTVANTAAQNLVAGTGNGVNPNAYANPNPTPKPEKTWFEQDTLIPSIPNLITGLVGAGIVVGVIFLATQDPEPKKRRK